MKKLLLFVSTAALAALLSFAFTACGDDEDIGTSLTIKNESFTDIIDVSWNGSRHAAGVIHPAASITLKNVTAGSGYIFFWFRNSGGSLLEARTRDTVMVEKDEQGIFIFTGNTLIAEIQNPNNFGTLGSF
jgi:uncharacterized protein YcfL